MEAGKDDFLGYGNNLNFPSTITTAIGLYLTVKI
jgi:hypothetical protein